MLSYLKGGLGYYHIPRMIELILMLSLAPAVSAPTMTAKVKPCVFPNTCVGTPQVVQFAKVRPCVFPNTCGGSQNG